MDPPRTRSRSRSGFYHFSVNGNVGGSGGAAGSGGLMSAGGGGLSFPQPQSNPGWAPHHGGRSYPENQQQQHNQGSYLAAGAQRHSAHGAHRHPGPGEQASAERRRRRRYVPGLTESTPSGQAAGALADLETCNSKPPCVFPHSLLAAVAD